MEREPITEATAGDRLNDALTRLLNRPDWRPTRAHVETARNELAAARASIARLTAERDAATARAEQAERERDALACENEMLRAQLDHEIITARLDEQSSDKRE